MSLSIWITLLGLFFLSAWQTTFAATIVYIDKSPEPSNTFRQLETAAQFYGLDVHTLDLAAGKQKVSFTAIHNQNVVAIVITADALPTLSRSQFFKENDRRIPLLIADITEKTNPALLNEWSSGSIAGSQRSTLEPEDSWYAIAKVKDVTRQLGGVRLPLIQREVHSLTMSNGGGGLSLIDATHGNTKFPVFARTRIDGQDVFFAAEIDPIDIPVTPDPYRQQAVFGTLAAPIVFLHYAAGERAWHSPGDYANLTIDDIWLREPYGHVNYEELLSEAQQHNFHATVAFIPWNFDRSQPRMVSLFQAHPDRLSICVHGNNHVHQEFGPLGSHPLSGQVEDIKQGLARMERFSQLTHLPYDAVMVFPHSISPVPTLAELKRYNFLATANSLNVPSDAQAPSDAEFALRTATLQFANFPSLRRYSAETDIPTPQLAIDAFLGNPMLFYAHESFFSSGMGAFNNVADTVNRLQPDTQWQSLGYIARHLYLEKLRDDGSYDVKTYSSTFDLDNSHPLDVTFFVEKDEDFALPVTVLVDGIPHPYQRSGAQLRLQLQIRRGMGSRINIKYGNDLNLAAVDISKNSFRINTIRLLSDFRDDVVSRTSLGRRFIHSYAENGNVWNRAMAISASLIIMLLIFWHIRRRRGRSLASPAHQLRDEVSERTHS
jgi:hypothetical protein